MSVGGGEGAAYAELVKSVQRCAWALLWARTGPLVPPLSHLFTDGHPRMMCALCTQAAASAEAVYIAQQEDAARQQLAAAAA